MTPQERAALYGIAVRGQVERDPAAAVVVAELVEVLIERRRRTTVWMVGVWLVLGCSLLGLAMVGTRPGSSVFVSGFGPLLGSAALWSRRGATLARAARSNWRVAALGGDADN